jgi:sulfite exporter TauE/SafE
LILLGILNLTGLLSRLTQRLTPANWTVADTELLATPDARGRARGMVKKFGYYQLLRPLSIGLVHGLAGSAAVALLVLSLIRNPMWAIAYLVVFGMGTVVGMMAMTTVMAIPIALSGKKSSRYLTVASGLVSVCFGLFLIYRIGFVDGLFTGHVHWTPQ